VEQIEKYKESNMDIFKKMGITVGTKPLIEEHTAKSETDNEIVHTNIIRKGAGLSPRDILEQQLAKGGISIRPMTDEEMSDSEDKKKAKVVNEHLKNTHGEEFHSDNDKQVEKLLTEGEVIQSEFEDEKPVKIVMKSMSVLDALSDIVKGGVGSGVKGHTTNSSHFPTMREYKRETRAQSKSPNSYGDGLSHERSSHEKGVHKPVSDTKDSGTSVARFKNPGKTSKEYHEKVHKEIKEIKPNLPKSFGAEEVKMPKKEFKEEHKKLINVLESPSHKDDKKEAKEQKKELDAMKACKKSFSDAMDVLDSLIKGDAPKGISKKEIEKMKNLHENSEGVAEKKKEVAYKSEAKVVPFLKSVGPGGMVFDFGSKTGNPLADNATMLLQENSDPVQTANAMYNANSYNRALKDYVEKGETAYMQEATPYGNIDKDWSKQLNTPMDVQVKEAFEKGQLVDDNSKPAVVNSFNKTEMTLGGQVIKATSETDAALIEMMKGSLVEDDGTGMIAEIGGGESRVAEIS